MTDTNPTGGGRTPISHPTPVELARVIDGEPMLGPAGMALLFGVTVADAEQLRVQHGTTRLPADWIKRGPRKPNGGAAMIPCSARWTTGQPKISVPSLSRTLTAQCGRCPHEHVARPRRRDRCGPEPARCPLRWSAAGVGVRPAKRHRARRHRMPALPRPDRLPGMVRRAQTVSASRRCHRRQGSHP